MCPRKKKETPEVQPPALDEPVAEPCPPGATPAVQESFESVPIIQQMVAFHLGGQRYGIPITSVQEIQQIVAFAQQEGATHAVVGMVNLRGAVIPAIDTRVLLGMPREEYRLDTPMIICRTGDGLVALIVDEVEDVVILPPDCLAPPPKLHALADRMIGVCRLDTDLVFLLSVEKLVSPLGITVGGW